MSEYRIGIETGVVANEYRATIRVNTGGGVGKISDWTATGSTLREATSKVVARVRTLAEWKGSSYRGVGRKPRHYRAARQAVAFLDSMSPTNRTLVAVA
jgi:hypothetical protein